MLYGLVGAGGFGREVMPLAEAMLGSQFPRDSYEIVFVEESIPSLNKLNDYRMMSVDEFFSHPARQKFFNVAISNSASRRKMVEIMLARGAKSFRIEAINVMNLVANQIDEGAILCGFSAITANAVIGKYFHGNIYSYVAHDCVIGDYVTFAPNVHCNGNVVIEDDVYVGAGAMIRQGSPEKPLVIGRGAVIGMGAVVVKDVSPFETVVGNPARPLRSRQIA